jgi:hypothetical protein
VRLFDPTTDSFGPIVARIEDLAARGATLLDDGRVLVVTSGEASSQAVVFDPAALTPGT